MEVTKRPLWLIAVVHDWADGFDWFFSGSNLSIFWLGGSMVMIVLAESYSLRNVSTRWQLSNHFLLEFDSENFDIRRFDHIFWKIYFYPIPGFQKPSAQHYHNFSWSAKTRSNYIRIVNMHKTRGVPGKNIRESDWLMFWALKIKNILTWPEPSKVNTKRSRH